MGGVLFFEMYASSTNHIALQAVQYLRKYSPCLLKIVSFTCFEKDYLFCPTKLVSHIPFHCWIESFELVVLTERWELSVKTIISVQVTTTAAHGRLSTTMFFLSTWNVLRRQRTCTKFKEHLTDHYESPNSRYKEQTNQQIWQQRNDRHDQVTENEEANLEHITLRMCNLSPESPKVRRIVCQRPDQRNPSKAWIQPGE